MVILWGFTGFLDVLNTIFAVFLACGEGMFDIGLSKYINKNFNAKIKWIIEVIIMWRLREYVNK